MYSEYEFPPQPELTDETHLIKDYTAYPHKVNMIIQHFVNSFDRNIIECARLLVGKACESKDPQAQRNLAGRLPNAYMLRLL